MFVLGKDRILLITKIMLISKIIRRISPGILNLRAQPTKTKKTAHVRDQTVPKKNNTSTIIRGKLKIFSHVQNERPVPDTKSGISPVKS